MYAIFKEDIEIDECGWSIGNPFICLICTVIVRCVILLALQAVAIMIYEVRTRHDDKVS
jgi:hypothetical protein